ncbi:MAG TPA: ATP-binding protein [Longimicrobium sp.]|nr:ATP-binding protein [Longimicrobium sp.]
MDGRARGLVRWAAWLAAAAALTGAMAAVRADLEKVHVALAYLLLVLAASALGTRALGFAVAVAAFLGFNFFFLPPYQTFGLSDRRDWLVLFTFLTVAAVATQLLHRARRQAAEVERLSLEAGRARALREADRLKDALIASVSHDLRTPLTTIKALAHDLGEAGDERAVIIEEEADRLNRFVADLLDLSRLNAGELRVSPEIVAAEDLLGAALQRVQGPMGSREIRVDLHPGEPLLLGRMDFVQSLRVLVNLLENAHKYAPPATPIDVSAGREGERLVFRVADRGHGIPDGERERIFQPFYRHPGGVADVGGAGLGLSISRRLAEAQGGSLTHEPRTGGGSVFVFTLPAAELEGAPG